MNKVGKRDYKSADQRWSAVQSRDPNADGVFFYAVKTTGVFCRPVCKARTPKKENVEFFDTVELSEQSGYRACKRCKPKSESPQSHQKKLMLTACRMIEAAEEEPSLADLAKQAALSPSYFNRLFKSIIGVTPKQYAIAHRAKKVAGNLKNSRTVTEAIYDAGFNASSRYYETSRERQGMTATRLRKGGEGLEIRYGFAEVDLGKVIIAATEMGICSVLIGEAENELLRELQTRFPKAEFSKAEEGSDFETWVRQTVSHLNDSSTPFDLPLDVKGTAFQEQVWRALRNVPHGETVSYASLAEKIGNPDAVRAVAGACAANPVAVVIPCHRVVRSDGSLSGYRWGRDRKQALLQREDAGRFTKG